MSTAHQKDPQFLFKRVKVIAGTLRAYMQYHKPWVVGIRYIKSVFSTSILVYSHKL